ncbi:MAG: energy transducer TonB, partial [Cellvibrionaceae bacterium]|nr:energy transducer TonB [Cellvibrionaceae bacterium]
MKLPVYFCLAMLLLVGNSMCLAGLNISPHRYDQAQLLHLPKPHYPPKARREGREGWVILSLVVDSQGNPQNPIVIDTVGSKQFASRALAAARQAKFKPAQLNGKTVSASNVRVRVDFALTRPGFKRAGVSKVFNQHYRRAERFLKSRNLSKATRAIQHLEQTYTRNNSEQLWLSLLKARLFFYRGHANGQIQQLQRSLALPAVEFSKQLHQKILADL